MKQTRRSFAAGAATVTTGLLRFPAGAAEFTYKYANAWAPSHPLSIRATQAAGRVLSASNGRLQIRVFLNGVLGSNAGMLSQTRQGAIELTDLNFNAAENVSPVLGLAALPFAFSGHQQCFDANDGAFGKFLHTAVEKLSLYAFDPWWDGGFRQMTNNIRPIRTPDDLKGLKMRTAPSTTAVNTFRALGASPVATEGSEMYTAAQTHLVDGTDLPFPSVEAFKMYEVQKYGSIVNWAWNGSILVANPDAWQKLPNNLREIVDQSFGTACLEERADIVKLENSVQATLQGQGMQINQAEIPQFKGKISAVGLYSQWRTRYGAEGFGLLERIVGKLA